MKKILVMTIIALSFAFAGEGIEYVQKGMDCKDRGNRSCTISNLEKALDTGELNQNQTTTVKNFLRIVYHEIIERNIDRWSLKKSEKHCKRAIELSDELLLSDDWYNISFYLWRAIAHSRNGKKAKAKQWARKAEQLMNKGKYKQGFNRKERQAFDKWAYKIIRVVDKKSKTTNSTEVRGLFGMLAYNMSKLCQNTGGCDNIGSSSSNVKSDAYKILEDNRNNYSSKNIKIKCLKSGDELTLFYRPKYSKPYCEYQTITTCLKHERYSTLDEAAKKSCRYR